MLELSQAEAGLALLAEAGMRKVNFSGGEPFLYADAYLGPMLKYSKECLNIESTSIVSNGLLITKEWIDRYGYLVDVFALSCDSFASDINKKIGRGNVDYLDLSLRLKSQFGKYGTIFKLNTVVNKLNYSEDMNLAIEKIAPFRWKCFQTLKILGENSGPGALKDASNFFISNDEFQRFLETHRAQPCLVHESNDMMRDSYLILDERMRFLNRRNNTKSPSQSILVAGVAVALEEAGFDRERFIQRGGIYDWSRDNQVG